MQSLGSIPPATLTTRLIELEQAGILERTMIDGRPPRTEYRLTARGHELNAARRRAIPGAVVAVFHVVVLATSNPSPEAEVNAVYHFIVKRMLASVIYIYIGSK